MTQNYSWQIHHSKWLIRLLTFGYVLAFSASFLNALTLVIKVSLAMVIVLYGFFTLKRLAHELWQLDYDEENGWQLFEFSRLRSIEILPTTVVSRYFIFLHYQFDGKKFYRLIFKDALAQNINDFRQLMVTLKTY
ncbi:MAG: hypothetical protein PHC99_10555 [Methylococcales bacterium]|nr:hypothetical protein [Methylococcales bacterium]